ncbi:hypothetical protein [Streptomyces virginiae]|uniref:hypothetical protein n=1 Tax=Streptomyces virginiae TaxID=1961 RepID=UPI00365ED9B3
MGGTQDKRQVPGKGREEQQRTRRPGQDPVHPEQPSRGTSGEAPERERRRDEDVHRDERDVPEEDF